MKRNELVNELKSTGSVLVARCGGGSSFYGETATAENISQRTSESASKAIDILKQWKSVRDEYMVAKHGDESSWLRSLDLGDEMDRLYASAVRVMTEEVFDDVTEYDVIDWMYDEYDALMSDLADIVRGDY